MRCGLYSVLYVPPKALSCRILHILADEIIFLHLFYLIALASIKMPASGKESHFNL